MTDARSRYTGSPSSAAPGADPSITDLIGDLARGTQELVQQEIALAKTEFSEAASTTVKAVVKIAAGALVLYAGFLFLLAAAVFGLRQADFSWWASALIVGGATALVGLLLLLIAKSQLGSVSFVPEETMKTLKQDADWAKGQVG